MVICRNYSGLTRRSSPSTGSLCLNSPQNASFSPFWDRLHESGRKPHPVLAENCYKCHAADSKKIKGGILLDRKAGWVEGGDSGEVIVPGDIELPTSKVNS